MAMAASAPTPTLGNVELQKDPSSRFWYSGRVVDVRNDTEVFVTFENDVWPRAEYSVSHIRKPPKLSPAELEKFNPAVNEEVELYVASTEHAPAGWGLAVVRNIRHDLYFVAQTQTQTHSSGSVSGSAPSAAEAIVEKDKLRPKTPAGAGGLAGGLLKQETYKIPRGLEGWVRTPDALGCFAHIEEQSGLLLIQIMKSDLKLVGDQKTIHRAKILLQLHVKHQGQIHSFQESLEKQLTALEKKRNRIEGVGYKHSVEFPVHPDAIPRIIGKGGDHIRSLQDKYDVLISVLPDETGDSPERIVRIFGNNLDQIQRTRRDVEYVEEVMQVEPQMGDWILGYRGVTINKFRDIASLVYARLEPGEDGEDQSTLRLMGLRDNVQDAKILFETHMMYYNVFYQMDEDMEQIAYQLQECGEYNALELTWYREEDEGGDWKGGKGAKRGKGGKPGGGKGSGKKGKDWEDPWQSKGKGGKGKPKGASSLRRFAAVDEDFEEEDSPPKPPLRGRGGKGGQGKGGRQNRRLEEEEEDMEEEEDDRPPPPPTAKGRGRAAGAPPRPAGRAGRGAAVGSAGALAVGGRAAAAAAALPEREPPKLGPSGRRMGKKGLRS